MFTLRLTGTITEDGHLKVDLPAGLPPGKVEIQLELDVAPKDLPWELRPFTEEELQEPLTSKRATGTEVIAMREETDGWWQELDTQDSPEWVEEQHHKEDEISKDS